MGEYELVFPDVINHMKNTNNISLCAVVFTYTNWEEVVVPSTTDDRDAMGMQLRSLRKLEQLECLPAIDEKNNGIYVREVVDILTKNGSKTELNKVIGWLLRNMFPINPIKKDNVAMTQCSVSSSSTPVDLSQVVRNPNQYPHKELVHYVRILFGCLWMADARLGRNKLPVREI